jgi:hypothetical protein
VSVGSGVFEGAGVFVEDGITVTVGGLSVEVSVTVDASVAGEGLHPVIQMTTISKVKIREMYLLSLSMDLDFRERL